MVANRRAARPAGGTCTGTWHLDSPQTDDVFHLQKLDGRALPRLARRDIAAPGSVSSPLDNAVLAPLWFLCVRLAHTPAPPPCLLGALMTVRHPHPPARDTHTQTTKHRPRTALFSVPAATGSLLDHGAAPRPPRSCASSASRILFVWLTNMHPLCVCPLTVLRFARPRRADRHQSRLAALAGAEAWPHEAHHRHSQNRLRRLRVLHVQAVVW